MTYGESEYLQFDKKIEMYRSNDTSLFLLLIVAQRDIVYQARKPRSTPAATAEPITPATLGPIACMSR